MTNEPSYGSFPTMGTEAAVLKRSGKPERGRERPCGNGAGADIPGTGDKKNRRAVGGKMGATLHPTATLYEANAAEATQGQRNVVQVPSRSSWTDQFRAKAKYGRTM